MKSQGNIVCFRNLKNNTDEAIALFSDTGAEETIIIDPYENYVEVFNAGVLDLKAIAFNPDAVNALISEEDQLKFVRAFRQLMRTLNVLKSFTEFRWMDLDLSEQEFEDFKSKYLDIYERSKASSEERASIIDEVDFELELIHRDEINVAYILKLLAELHRRKEKEGETPKYEKKKKAIIELLSKETQLRSKRELIERFINENMPALPVEADVEKAFESFWTVEKEEAVRNLCQSEGMEEKAVYAMIEEINFSGKEPLRDTIFSALHQKPKLMERKKIFERVLDKLRDIIETFVEGV